MVRIKYYNENDELIVLDCVTIKDMSKHLQRIYNSKVTSHVHVEFGEYGMLGNFTTQCEFTIPFEKGITPYIVCFKEED